MNGPMYDHEEYSKLQIDLLGKGAVLRQLDAAYTGLETIIHTEDESPLAITQLFSLSEEEIAYFNGKTVSQALTDQNVKLEHLKILKDYGKMMLFSAQLAQQTERCAQNAATLAIAGALIYNLAIAQAVNIYETNISRNDTSAIKDNFDTLSVLAYVVPSVQKILEAASGKLGPKGGSHVLKET